MNMLTRLTILLTLIVSIGYGCKNTEGVKRSPSGAAGDMLIVMDDSLRKSEAGKLIFDMMTQPMLGLPQPEAIFTVSVMPHRGFMDHTKSMRNILYIEVGNKKYTDTVLYFKNHWASDQAVAQIYASSKAMAAQLATNHEIRLVSFFTRAERERIVVYNNKYPNAPLVEQVKEQWGIQLSIPSGFNRNKSSDTFTWLSLEGPVNSTGFIIYSVPYVGEGSFSKEYLLNKRDSILNKNIPGSAEGTYMTTEHQYPIHYKQLTISGQKTAEMRGLWKVQGDLMGGPFVSHVHYDEKNNRMLVTEGYVYAPEKPNKRNFIRQIEAILYSYKPINVDEKN
jgi:hypothetical protein